MEHNETSETDEIRTSRGRIVSAHAAARILALKQFPNEVPLTPTFPPLAPHPQSCLRGNIDMNDPGIISSLKDFLSESYPGISIRIEPWRGDPARSAIYFEHEKFAALYPMQRYHYLIHAIPEDFYRKHLSECIWVELAPGETEDDLRYPDEELMESISPDVLHVLGKSGFFARLDDLMSPPEEGAAPAACHGDFRHTKRVLAEKGFGERNGVDEVFDVCHVLMAKGGYCDCEVLYNVAEESRLKAKHWQGRAKPGSTSHPASE
jgi:hypothetical protein